MNTYIQVANTAKLLIFVCHLFHDRYRKWVLKVTNINTICYQYSVLSITCSCPIATPIEATFSFRRMFMQRQLQMCSCRKKLMLLKTFS